MQRQQTVNQQSILSPSKFCREFWWWLDFLIEFEGFDFG